MKSALFLATATMASAQLLGASTATYSPYALNGAFVGNGVARAPAYGGYGLGYAARAPAYGGYGLGYAPQYAAAPVRYAAPVAARAPVAKAPVAKAAEEKPKNKFNPLLLMWIMNQGDEGYYTKTSSGYQLEKEFSTMEKIMLMSQGVGADPMLYFLMVEDRYKCDAGGVNCVQVDEDEDIMGLMAILGLKGGSAAPGNANIVPFLMLSGNSMFD